MKEDYIAPARQGLPERGGCAPGPCARGQPIVKLFRLVSRRAAGGRDPRRDGVQPSPALGAENYKAISVLDFPVIRAPCCRSMSFILGQSFDASSYRFSIRGVRHSMTIPSPDADDDALRALRASRDLRVDPS